MSPSKKPSLTAKEKLRPISGFPELLPEERRVELDWIDQIRTIFESYGFTSIEPRTVEPIDVLLKQGDTDKEIQLIKEYCTKLGVKVNLCKHWAEGGSGARGLAENVIEICKNSNK